MLQRSLGAAAALLMSDRFTELPRAAAGRAIVIGGGFTGLAAPTNVKAGYDVTVVEARNRVGGRVLSFSDLVPGKHVEGGGELIGFNHPPGSPTRRSSSSSSSTSARTISNPQSSSAASASPRTNPRLREEMEKPYNAIVERGANRCGRAVEGRQCRALDARTLATGSMRTAVALPRRACSR